MPVIKQHRSPNFSDRIIPVEFVVIHYTATDLSNTLRIFKDEKREVSSHFVIDGTGETFELVEAYDGQPKRAWHAGKSSFHDGLKTWESFNDFSIGIELVNFNGNIFSYSDAQYAALFELIAHLKIMYPALKDPARIIGHEQIAGFRGKADPGAKFDWSRLFTDLYPGISQPLRTSLLSEDACSALLAFSELGNQSANAATHFWPAVSSLCEKLCEKITPKKE